MVKKSVSLVVLALAFVAFGAAPAYATNGRGHGQQNQNHKVTICHGTNAVNNPYIKESVDDDAADGNTGNDNGKGDHSTHTGPVATSEAVAQALKDAKTAWGDIIPPHHNFPGLNWTAEGQAIYNNDCKYVVVDEEECDKEDEEEEKPETPTTPVTPTTPTVPTTPTPVTPVTTTAAAASAPVAAVTPVSGVDAGAGGATASTLPAVFALVASALVAGYGALRLRKLVG
jgi:hypothetical protein